MPTYRRTARSETSSRPASRSAVIPGAAPDWEWQSAADDSPEQLRALWDAAVARSRAVVTEALAAGGPDGRAHFTTPGGESPSLRYILVVMIEEYARHVGHADLLREAVDGLVGEDPPR